MALDLDMTPIFTRQDASQGPAFDAVFLHEGFGLNALSVGGANSDDLFFVEDSFVTSRPSLLVAPSFGFFVSHVVAGSSDEEMIGANTKRIVTSVEDVGAGRGIAVGDYPSGAARRYGATRKVESSIPMPVLCSGPQPAFICFADFIPETFHQDVMAQHRGACNA